MSLADDVAISERTNQWRYDLMIHRVTIPKLRVEIMASETRLLHIRDTSEGKPCRALETIKMFADLLHLCSAVESHVDKSTQALLASVSIIESQNAVRQGHEVQKLTELAFVFIPVTFVTSYFGMELKVFCI